MPPATMTSAPTTDGPSSVRNVRSVIRAASVCSANSTTNDSIAGSRVVAAGTASNAPARNSAIRCGDFHPTSASTESCSMGCLPTGWPSRSSRSTRSQLMPASRRGREAAGNVGREDGVREQRWCRSHDCARARPGRRYAARRPASRRHRPQRTPWRRRSGRPRWRAVQAAHRPRARPRPRSRGPPLWSAPQRPGETTPSCCSRKTRTLILLGSPRLRDGCSLRAGMRVPQSFAPVHRSIHTRSRSSR